MKLGFFSSKCDITLKKPMLPHMGGSIVMGDPPKIARWLVCNSENPQRMMTWGTPPILLVQ